MHWQKASNSIGKYNNEKNKKNNDVNIPTSNRNYILDIGEVFQSAVKSSNGSMISFSGYHSQCV